MITLYDADRCPYCARVRIVLAEKGVEYETVVIDLDDRPAWIYEKNSTGRVPVLEEDAFLLPESAVIDEYLNERYPDPPLLPDDPGERALARTPRPRACEARRLAGSAAVPHGTCIRPHRHRLRAMDPSRARPDGRRA